MTGDRPTTDELLTEEARDRLVRRARAAMEGLKDRWESDPGFKFDSWDMARVAVDAILTELDK